MNDPYDSFELELLQEFVVPHTLGGIVKNKVDILLDHAKAGEVGDAQLFAKLYSRKAQYDHTEKAWYVWGKHNWQVDKTGSVYLMVGDSMASYYLGAGASCRNKGMVDKERELLRRANELRQKRRVTDVLFLAAREPGIALKGDEWDRDPWLLGCANGVIDLRTGGFRDGLPGDYIRSISPTEWMGLGTPAPHWEQFLQDIFGGDGEMIDFIQRLFGYAVSGLTREHILPILYGEEGRNGKGTLLEVLGEVVGPDLACTMPADAIMDTARRDGNAPQPYVANLRGKRLVWMSESSEGRKMSTGLVKLLCGGDRINARGLNKNPIEFLPSHQILLITNNKPAIPADDSALWQRVFLIPFEQIFIDDPDPNKDNEHLRDPAMKERLLEEAPGILAWLVKGYLSWQEISLNPPDKVMAATKDYRAEEDEVQQFIDEEVTPAPGKQIRADQVYHHYKIWCAIKGITHMSNTSFGKRMKKKVRSKRSNGLWYLDIDIAGISSTIPMQMP
jgi:putative DNA primase/helicase